MARQINVPHAIEDSDRLARDLAGGSRPIFLDYDDMTPIVDRPEDALISESMRETVQEARRALQIGRGQRAR